MPRSEAMIAERWTETTKEIADRFAAWMAERRMSQPEAARLLDVSHSTLSPMLAHKYTGDVAGICAAMERVMGRSRLRAAAGRRPAYATTSVTEEVVRACGIAHAEGIISLVLGPSGIGKTAGMLRYCEQEPEAMYVAAGIGASPWACLRLIAQRLEIPYHCNARQLRENLANLLRGTSTMLIIDELDYVREPTLQVLRMLHDDAKIGMVWGATPALLERIQGAGSPTLRQVMRRVRFVARLGYCSCDDIRKVLDGYQLDEGVLDAVLAGAAGELDRAISVVVRAQSMRNGQPTITPDIVARAYGTLPPADHA